MKTKILFICFISLFTVFSLSSQTTAVDSIVEKEPFSSHQKVDVVDGDVFLDSLLLIPNGEEHLLLKVIDVYGCRVKVKSFKRRFWLADSTTLGELMILLRSGGRILKTKGLSKPKVKIPDWQKDFARKFFEALLLKTDRTDSDCNGWFCKLLNFLEKARSWIIGVSSNEKEGVEVRKKAKH